MNCRIVDLRNKDVINIRDGTRLGYVGDVEVDTVTARLVAIVIYGRLRFFGLLGREDDCVIDWSSIEVIGEDTVLVNCAAGRRCRRRGCLDSLLCALTAK